MKKLLFSVILVILATSIHSQETNPTLSILDFAVSGISEKEGLLLVDYMSSAIHQTEKFRVIDRSQRETILKELQFSLSGCSD